MWGRSEGTWKAACFWQLGCGGRRRKDPVVYLPNTCQLLLETHLCSGLSHECRCIKMWRYFAVVDVLFSVLALLWTLVPPNINIINVVTSRSHLSIQGCIWILGSEEVVKWSAVLVGSGIVCLRIRLNGVLAVFSQLACAVRPYRIQWEMFEIPSVAPAHRVH